jgi:hypothetical protein
MLKIIFFKSIILIHFRVNNTLKNNNNHTSKHPLSILHFTYYAYLIWKIRLQILKKYFKFSFPDFVSLPGVGVCIWFVLLFPVT